jgi:DNA helicase-2/ATP-dependent DNA helicase PcrA
MNPHLLSGLNDAQREAAETLRGPLLVLAGAGSGKTRVLTHRIAWLLENGVRPWEVLAVTFTNKAAAEMKHRVGQLVGPQARDLTVSTFHSFCVRVLRQSIEPLGWSRRFTIYDTDDQRRLLKRIMQERRIDHQKWKPAAILRRIDAAKNRLITPEQYEDHFDGPVGDPTASLYPLYNDRLKAADAVDFNDLINLTVRLWTHHPDVLRRYRDKYRYLLVDEYQDTNRAQFLLVRLLGGTEEDANVMVVGDDDQSIYGFRGADISNILDFADQWPRAKVVRLEQNYRSTGHILRAANEVVKNNGGRMAKTLWTDRGDGEKIRMLVGGDETDEAESVVRTIDRLVQGGQRYGDIAIIYRTNAASRAFEKALVRVQMPHVLVGAARFYDRREVKDIISYLKLVLNPSDDMAFERVVNTPRRGVGPKTVDDIRAVARHHGVGMLEAAGIWVQTAGRGRKGVDAFLKVMDTLWAALETVEPHELVHVAARESGYIEDLERDDSDESRGRIENIEELQRAVSGELGEDEDAPEDQTPLQRLQDFLDRATLTAQADDLPDSDDRGRVTLLTAHLAKGLEFPVVFVAGMFQGGFPHFMSQTEEDLEEERRLVYVAFTRAMRRLYLTRPRRRFSHQTRNFEETQPSRFLEEIPNDVIEWGGSGGFRRGGAEDRAARLARLGFADVRRRSAGAEPPRSKRVPRFSPPAAAPAPAPAPTGHHRSVALESLDQLRAGVRVLHGRFGAGSVVRTSGSPGNLKVVVEFDAGGRRTLFARFAGLELLQS